MIDGDSLRSKVLGVRVDWLGALTSNSRRPIY